MKLLMGLISNIIQGWDDYLSEVTEPFAVKRQEVCKSCDYALKGWYEQFMKDEILKKVEGLKCGKCNCPLSTKLRSKNEKCPLGKWE